MNILFLEDRGSTASSIIHLLDENSFNTLRAFNISDAQKIWSNRKQVPVNCIILDLQVPMDGLTNEQRIKAEGGALAGWVWLQENVFAHAPQMKQNVIIYSSYVTTLRAKIPIEQLRGIMVISKNQQIDTVIARVRVIAKMIHG